MEKRYEIVKLPAANVEEIIRAAGAGLFDTGCAWDMADGRPCGLPVEYRATEVRRYSDKRGERERIWFFCTGHAVSWAKLTGAHGGTELFPLLVKQP